MTIVLNEREYAEQMIRNRELGDKPTETLRRVARYYLDNGYKKKEVRHYLDAFLLQCDPSASLPKWQESLDRVLARAQKTPAVVISSIGVTTGEIAKIDTLKSVQVRRLAFTLLCLSKYWNAVNGADSGWVSSTDSDIMRMANINTSIRRQSQMFKTLADEGLIAFSRKVGNTNVRVLFADETEQAIEIHDFRNLGYQYLKLKGQPFFECQCCGIVTKYSDPVHGRKQKYCKNCAATIQTQQIVNATMRKRKLVRELAQGVTDPQHSDECFSGD